MRQADSFDPEALRLSGTDLKSLPEQVQRKLPRHRPGEKFLKGPIPWNWLVQASRLRGKALHVAILLWREAFCAKVPTVPFRLSQARTMGMHSDTARRGLRTLETAGLVSVQRRTGRCSQVTILDIASTERSREGRP
jgi:hypothetical protein